MKSFIFLCFRKITSSYLGKFLKKILRSNFLPQNIYYFLNPSGLMLIETQGINLYVNTDDKAISPTLMMHGIYEKHEVAILKKLIKPGMIFVDIGANIGYFSLIAANIMQNKGRVYSFEPEPNNYDILLKNVENNDYENIIPINKAVSNYDGKIKFFRDKRNLGGHSFSKGNLGNFADFLEIEAVTLDSYFKDIVDNIDVIKIDTQGAEGLIIDGADNLLKNKNIKILMEYWPYGLRNMGADPYQLLVKMVKKGFKISFVDNGGILRKVKSIDGFEFLKDIENKEYEEYINLFLEY